MPPYQHRREQDDARPRPARDRPRPPRRAGAPPGAAVEGRVPVRHPARLGVRDLQRLDLDGLDLWLDAGAHGCRRADLGAGRRRRDGPHVGARRDVHGPHRHPRQRGCLRRHGLQGHRDPGRDHRPPDGHQGQGHQRGDHSRGAGQGPRRPHDHPRQDDRGPAVRPRHDERLRAAHHEDQDQPREDPRHHRQGRLHDPQDPGGDRHRDQRRGRRDRRDRGRRRARTPARRSSGSRASPARSRSAPSTWAP